MTFNEFRKKTAENSFIEPDTIEVIMKKLIEMPLNKMYSDAMNNLTETCYAEAYMLEPAELNILGNASRFKLKHFLHQLLMLYESPSKEEQYSMCLMLLAVWNNNYVPGRYERRRR